MIDVDAEPDPFVPEEKSGPTLPALLLVTRAVDCDSDTNRVSAGASSRRQRGNDGCLPRMPGLEARLPDPIQPNNVPFRIGE